MIKSDKWIRRQSTAPAFMVTERVLASPSIGHAFGTKDVTYPSWDSHEELERRRQLFHGSLGGRMPSNGGVLGVVGYRELTDDERAAFKPMIEPFEPNQVRSRPDVKMVDTPAGLTEGYSTEKVISYGTSSYGYDVRLGNQFKIFSNAKNALIDPLNMSDDCYIDHEGEFCIIPPNSYILGHTIEVFNIPRNVSVLCVGKSTYARAAALVNVTPIEAGFQGQVVIEIANGSSLPLKVYANMGIAQFIFFESDEACDVSYADRAGKYQNQMGITTARV